MGFFMHSCFTILIVTTEDWPLDEGPLLLKRPMCGHSMWVLLGLWPCGGVVSLLSCFVVSLCRCVFVVVFLSSFRAVKHGLLGNKVTHMVFSHRTATHKVVTFAKSAAVTKSDRPSPCNAPANKNTPLWFCPPLCCTVTKLLWCKGALLDWNCPLLYPFVVTTSTLLTTAIQYWTLHSTKF